MLKKKIKDLIEKSFVSVVCVDLDLMNGYL